MKLTRVLAGFASVALLVTSLVALLPDHAYACSGMGFLGTPQEHVKQELEESRAVFSGEVQDINEANGMVTFKTISVWKGPDRDTLEVANNAGTCAYTFEEGQEYIIYADYYPDQGLSVNLFNVQLLSEASEEVQALRLVDTSGIVPGSVVLGLAGLTLTAAFLLMWRVLKIR